MQDVPGMTPRQRILSEDDEQTFPSPEEEQLRAQREAVAEANRLAEDVQASLDERAEAADDDGSWIDLNEAVAEPQILTIIELEKQLERLEAVLQAIQQGVIDADGGASQADDALQGTAVILGMTFTGDIQMLVLATLSRYREIKGLR